MDMNVLELINKNIKISVDEYLELCGFKYHPKISAENNWMHDWSEVEDIMGEESCEYIDAYNWALKHYESYMADLIEKNGNTNR
jgi:hypothetical protein